MGLSRSSVSLKSVDHDIRNEYSNHDKSHSTTES